MITSESQTAHAYSMKDAWGPTLSLKSITDDLILVI